MHCLLTPSIPPEITFFFHVFLSSPHCASFFYHKQTSSSPSILRAGTLSSRSCPVSLFSQPNFWDKSSVTVFTSKPSICSPRGALAISIELQVSTPGPFLLEFSVHWKCLTTFYSTLKSMAPEGHLAWCLQGYLWPFPLAWQLCDVTCQVDLAFSSPHLLLLW